MTIDERRNDTAQKYRNLLVQCKKCIDQYEKDMAQNMLHEKKISKRNLLSRTYRTFTGSS